MDIPFQHGITPSSHHSRRPRYKPNHSAVRAMREGGRRRVGVNGVERGGGKECPDGSHGMMAPRNRGGNRPRTPAAFGLFF